MATEKENGDNSSLGEKLKIAAKSVGGGNSLARKTGIPRRTLESWFSNNTEPKATQLKLIAEATGVSLDWLVTEEGGFYDPPTNLAKDAFVSPHLPPQKFEAAVELHKNSVQATPDLLKEMGIEVLQKSLVLKLCNELFKYQKKSGIKLSDIDHIKMISSLYDMSLEGDEITEQFVEDLMKLKSIIR